ncbi:antibiotic biosynthesis monooxygenase [Caballeronia catudaia]|uniref:Antibiotic biosynthesis monooxygenase n=1 Tax=Caballeronia catudaia TaxID=1777136 RepID=A0A158DLM4_9BURK|nr:putative quinol monooxygenase [Caballeronia catudaia]SAK95541.1 antibiotic biosynthesis monooxygenase [Caballeronia catudaia]
MLTLIAYLHAKPEKREALEQILRSLVEPTRLEPDCIDYHFHRSVDDPNLFMFYENWRSRESLDQHLAMPHLANFWEHRLDYLESDVDLQFFEMQSALPVSA